MRSLRWPAAALAVGCAATVALPVVGATSHHLAESLRGMPQTVAYLAAAAFLTRSAPAHPVARRLTVFAVLMACSFPLGSAISAADGRLGTGWRAVGLWGLQLLDAGQWAAMVAICAVFPDGRYTRGLERRLVRVTGWGVPVVGLVELAGARRITYSGPAIWSDKEDVRNPVAIDGLHFAGTVAAGLLQAGLLLLAVGVALLVLRYRHFDAGRRRQITWPLYGFVLTVAGSVLLAGISPTLHAMPDWLQYLLWLPVVLLVPGAFAIGVAKDRLFDINLVIRRSVVYAVLWLVIAAAYVALATGFGVAVGQRVPLQVALVLTIAATLVAAPLRRRVERAADRLVFGRRLTGYELISHLGARLEAAPDAEDVASSVATNVRVGLDAEWVRVVAGSADRRPLAAAGVGLDEPAAPDLEVPLVHGAERIGAIECGRKRDGRYTESDRELLETLGRQAALAIRNSQLTRELSYRLDELDASRARLVHAEEASRRRLERDIHDGVQQQLAALLARLGLARNQLKRDPQLAMATLEEAHHDGRRALESLQELARGIHPPLLTDHGLLPAVEERAARLPIAAEIVADGLGGGRRFPSDVEGAAYFFCCEAFGNVLKHARASRISVRFGVGARHLCVEVADDGRGFAPDRVDRRGLRGLQDRIEALGGSIDVVSRPGRGTTVRAELPTGGGRLD
jgi:signal transduction histidine kinase